MRASICLSRQLRAHVKLAPRPRGQGWSDVHRRPLSSHRSSSCSDLLSSQSRQNLNRPSSRPDVVKPDFSTQASSLWARKIPKDDDAASLLENASPSLDNTRDPALTTRDGKISCAYFDSSGTLVNRRKELTKNEIAAQFELRHRDLRDIDLRSESITRILVRPATILLQFFDLCMIIQSNEALLIDLRGADKNGDQRDKSFYQEVESRMSVKEAVGIPELPYELRAVEAALVAVLSILRENLVEARREAEESVRKLKIESPFAAVGLDLLFEHSQRLGRIEQKARLVRDTLREILDTDEDLAAMYLSDREAGRPHTITDHQEAEYMLEAYHTAGDALVESARAAINVILKKENTFRSSLAVQRNQIMFLEVEIAVHTLGLAAGTLVAGLFGMNLVNYMEESAYGFPAMTGVSVVLCVLFSLYGMRNIRRIRRLRELDHQRTGLMGRHRHPDRKQ